MEILREQVLAALQEKILHGKIKPGERLVERSLAEELGVSRTPVRESFPVLEQQGLVRNSPGLGVVVRQINVREIRDSLEVRDVLDALAARRSAENRSDEDVVLIEAAMQLHDLAVARGEDKAIVETDSLFHARIHEAAANGVLLNVRNAFIL